jgi:hypothetical protein
MNAGQALQPLSERKGAHRTAAQINTEINQKITALQEGITFSIMLSPILGLGSGAGYSLLVEGRAGLGYGTLVSALGAFQSAASQVPGMQISDHSVRRRRLYSPVLHFILLRTVRVDNSCAATPSISASANQSG